MYIVCGQGRGYTFLLDNFIEGGGVLFFREFLYVKYAHLKRLCANVNFDYVALLDVVGSAGWLSVHGNLFCVAGFICNRTAFYEPGNL